ncbi:MAG: DMT family transporter [Alphaproteobacteria bacterium]
MAEGRVQQSTLRGIAWLSFGVTCFAVIDAIAKALSDTVGPIQITWARYAFFLLPLLVLTPVRLWAGTVRGPRLGLNLLRATIPTVAGLCAVLGLAITPLDLFTAVSFAAPLVVTALSGPMLGEHPGLRRWAAVVVGFGGILIIARPWDDAIGLGVAFALVLAVLFALYQLLTRMLTEGGEPRAMLLQVALIGFILTSLALPFGWRDVGLDDWVLMVVSGVVHAAAHFSILRAFSLAPASTLAPFIYVQIVGAIMLGYFWFGYVPDWTTIAGTAVVMACGLYIVHRERLQQARASL